MIFCGLHSIQAQIAGIINSYTQVIEIVTPCPKIKVTSTTGFQIGDKVLMIQMKGAEISTTNTAAAFGNILDYHDAGNYEFAEIKDIQGNDIYLKYELLRSYTPADLVQLITVPQYTDVIVTGTLTAPAWNGSIGGVLVFEASGTVTLNADIDVSGSGFRGGLTNIDDDASQLPCVNNLSLPNTSPIGAGKGESISNFILGAENGAGKQANGGGGGLWNNSGGGGGSNYGQGGKGGNAGACSIFPSLPGSGGAALIYNNSTSKIFLGGGGGAGHQNNYDGIGPPNRPGSTPGGDGAGIVVIRANTLDANTFSIYSKGLGSYIGESWGDGAGGGGGGGTVLLEIQTITSNFSIDVSGGKGDNLFLESGSNLGPGGGGGGGVVWVSTATPHANLSAIVSGGLSGIITSSNPPNANGALKGNNGGILTDLIIPEGNVTGTACTTPLQLIAFELSQKNNQVLLNWTTLQDEAVAYFQIQKSTDGHLFEPIGNVSTQTSAGVHNYSIKDQSVTDQELLYYRLVQFNRDGTQKVMSTKSIPNNASKKPLEISPNPFTDMLYIKTLIPISQLWLVDIHGKTVWKQTEVAEEIIFNINTQSLTSGFYILKVVQDGESNYFKLLK